MSVHLLVGLYLFCKFKIVISVITLNHLAKITRFCKYKYNRQISIVKIIIFQLRTSKKINEK